MAMYGLNRGRLNCPEFFCQFEDPKALLRWLNLENVSFLGKFIWIFALMIAFRAALYMKIKQRLTL